MGSIALNKANNNYDKLYWLVNPSDVLYSSRFTPYQASESNKRLKKLNIKSKFIPNSILSLDQSASIDKTFQNRSNYFQASKTYNQIKDDDIAIEELLNSIINKRICEPNLLFIRENNKSYLFRLFDESLRSYCIYRNDNEKVELKNLVIKYNINNKRFICVSLDELEIINDGYFSYILDFNQFQSSIKKNTSENNHYLRLLSKNGIFMSSTILKSTSKKEFIGDLFNQTQSFDYILKCFSNFNIHKIIAINSKTLLGEAYTKKVHLFIGSKK